MAIDRENNARNEFATIITILTIKLKARIIFFTCNICLIIFGNAYRRALMFQSIILFFLKTRKYARQYKIKFGRNK